MNQNLKFNRCGVLDTEIYHNLQGGSVMQIKAAAKLWLEYHECHSKENSIRAYKLILTQLCAEFGTEDLTEMTTERVLSFLNRITGGRKRQTKKTRYSHLLSFFNFIKNNIDQEFRNPCDTPMLKKLFRPKRPITGTLSIKKPLMRLFSGHRSQETA